MNCISTYCYRPAIPDPVPQPAPITIPHDPHPLIGIHKMKSIPSQPVVAVCCLFYLMHISVIPCLQEPEFSKVWQHYRQEFPDVIRHLPRELSLVRACA